MRKNSKSVFSGIVWSFGERITAQLVTLAVSIVLARLLGPEEYALTAIVTIFITIANAFVTGGFGNSLIQKKDADALDFSSVFVISLSLAVIFYLLIFMSAPLISKFYDDDRLTPIFRVMGLRIIVAAVNSIQHAYVSKQMAFKKFFVSTLFGTIISGVVGIVMAYKGCGVWSLVGQYLTNTTIDTIVLAFTCGWHPSIKVSFTRAKALFAYGWRILVSEVVATLYGELRGLVLSKFFSSVELSFYNQGDKYPALFNNNIEVSVNKVLFQKLSDEQDDLDKVKQITQKTIKITSFVMFPLFFGMAACAEPLISFLLTEKWLPCVPYLRISCMVYLITPLISSNTRVMKALGKSDSFLIVTLIRYAAGITLLIASFFLFHNSYIVVFSSFAAMFIMWVLSAAISGKRIKYGFFRQIKDVLPALLVSIAMFFCVLYVKNLFSKAFPALLVQLAVGVSVYLVLSFVFNRKMFVFGFEMLRSFFRKSKG